MTLPAWAPSCGEGCTNFAHYYVWVTREKGTDSHLRLHRQDIDLTVVQARVLDACSDLLRGRGAGPPGIASLDLDALVALIEFTLDDNDQVKCGHGPLGRDELMSVRELIRAAATLLQTA